ncbi:MAG: dTDP-4-dehydrorhamnose reductase [Alphaproteobacteria bacterium]|nr:dTDP-4-dehydrorhamnose reductase [Alphaproteobacteria bacterium]
MSDSDRHLLIFGANGQLGREALALAASANISAYGVERATCDITDAQAVAKALDAHKPALAINAAAYTAVDKAESEEALAFQINGEGPGVLARETAQRRIPLVHVSTDYVFDGSKQGAYVESDPVAPMGAYGRSKLAGEAAAAINPQHVILRTAWVYGVYGNNFLKTMLRLAREGDELRVVGDQRGCPTSTIDLAEALLAVAATIASGRDMSALWGLYHFAGDGETSWHGFAQEIVKAQSQFTGKLPPVNEITTSEYPTPARRPTNSALDSSRFANAFGYRARHWRERTQETVAILCGA